MIYNELEQRGTDDFPIELYHIESHHTRYEMSAHWHNEIELIRVLSGKLSVRLNNNCYEVRENEIIFVNPETVHQASPDECIYECIVCSTDLIPSLGEDCTHFMDSLKNHECLVYEYFSDKNCNFSKTVNELFDAMAHRTSGYKFKIIGTLCCLFGEIADSHLYTSPNGRTIAADKNVPKLKAVLSFIRNNYSSVITLEDMAKASGMSPKYFCYFFKEMTSKTPVEYLTLYRIEKASRKLINSDMSVTSVAFSCGFNDLSYFIKTFKQLKGITPARFRKQSLYSSEV